MKQIPTLEEEGFAPEQILELEQYFADLSKEGGFPNSLTAVISSDEAKRRSISSALFKKYRDVLGDMSDGDGGCLYVMDTAESFDFSSYPDYRFMELTSDAPDATFETLRAVVRCDPAYVLVQNINDQNSYTLAAQMAETGQVVVFGTEEKDIKAVGLMPRLTFAVGPNGQITMTH